MAANPPLVERLLGDYEGENAPLGRMTIVNQPVNIDHFQLHPSIIRQLERRPFSGMINEANDQKPKAKSQMAKVEKLMHDTNT